MRGEKNGTSGNNWNEGWKTEQRRAKTKTAEIAQLLHKGNLRSAEGNKRKKEVYRDQCCKAQHNIIKISESFKTYLSLFHYILAL